MADPRTPAAEELTRRRATDPRRKGIERTRTAEDMIRRSGSVRTNARPAPATSTSPPPRTHLPPSFTPDACTRHLVRTTEPRP